jgi:hypothetical protein
MKLTNLLDLQKNSLVNAVIHPAGADPVTSSEGQIWWRTDLNALRVYDGTGVETVAFISDIVANSLSANLFNAFTILAADADNTPVPLTVPPSTLVGRDSTGGITALSADVIQTILNLENGATADQSPAEILAALLTVDGIGSGLDADSVGGIASTDVATQEYVATQLADLIGAAPGTLDTLNEIAAALGDDPNFATTITNALGLRTEKFSAAFGDGTATSFTIIHSLNTLNFTISIRETTSGSGVIADWKPSGVNAVQIDMSTAPAVNFYTVTIVG